MGCLLEGDCLELIKYIPTNSVDLVVIDPPYEIETSSVNPNAKTGAFGSTKRKYHVEILPLTDGIKNNILNELVRVMKKINIYIWCNKTQIRQYVNFFEDLGCSTELLTWHKTNPVPTCNNKYLSDTEYLLFFREKGVKIYGKYATKRKYYVTATNKADKEKYGHPTIKPLEIIQNLIINSSQEGDTVLDCFMGSGTTGVACKETNRKFIGIEKDSKYFEIAKRRIYEYSASRLSANSLR